MFGSRFMYSSGIVNYTITPDVTTVYEGSIVTYTVATTGVPDGTVLYWSTSGTVAAADFSDSTLTGSVTINSDTATFTRSIVFDASTEASETMIMSLLTGSVSGTVVAVANTVNVLEGIGITQYSSMADGYTYNLTLSHRTISTVFYWEIVHITTDATYFSATSGSVTTAGASAPYTATIPITTTISSTISGDKTFKLRIRFTDAAGTIVYTSQTITLMESVISFYTYPTTLPENYSTTIGVRVSNRPSGLTVPTLGWTINHISTASTDFNTTSGNLTTAWNGTLSTYDASFNLITLYDLLNESDETFQIEARWGGNAGVVMNTGNIITIPQWTMSFISQPTTMLENTQGVFTVATNNLGVGGGTTPNMYWTLKHGTTDDTDFGASYRTGNVLLTWVAGNSAWEGSFTTLTAYDILTESAETFQMEARIGSNTGPVMATSSVVTIPTWTMAFISQPTTMLENTQGVFTVATNNLGTGGGSTPNMYWTLKHGTTVDADFGASYRTGNVLLTYVSANSAWEGSFTTITSYDILDESAETFQMEARIGSNVGPVMATSSIVTIPTWTMSFVSQPTTMLENTQGTFKVATNNLGTGGGSTPNIYWTLKHGTTDDTDFASSYRTGNVLLTYVSANSAWEGSFTTITAYDILNESDETFQMEARIGSNVGPVMATSSVVTIPTWTLAFTSQPTTVWENNGGVFTVATTNLGTGGGSTPNIFWNLKHGTTDDTDFVSTYRSGNVLLSWVAANSAWEGSFTTFVSIDTLNEPAETFQVEARIGSNIGPVMATSSNVTISPWTMTFSSQPTTLFENTVGTFTVSTANLGNQYGATPTLFWNVKHITTDDADFSGVSGNTALAYNSNTASWSNSFSVLTQLDALNEPAETFQVEARIGSNVGAIMATSSVVTIPQWTLAFTSQPTTQLENTVGSFTVSTANLGQSRGQTPIIYWNILHGTTVDADFNGVTGSVTLAWDSANSVWSNSFGVLTQLDALNESAETFQVEARIGNNTGALMATSSVVTIPQWTMSFTSQPTTQLENTVGTFTLTTNNLGQSRGQIPIIYWNVKHITTDDADFNGVTGSVTLAWDSANSVWSNSFNVLTQLDTLNESAETFQVEARLGNNTGDLIATSSVVTIPQWTLAFTTTPTTINEGSGGTFVVTTNNLGQSRGQTPIIYWNILHGTTTNVDFNGGVVSGSTTLTWASGNSTWGGSFTVNVVTDALIESDETFQVEARLANNTGTLMATSSVVTIPYVPTYTAATALFTAAQSTALGVYSTNGTTWTEVAMPSNSFWVDTNFNPGNTTRGVAVAWSGSSFAYTSNKGVSWTTTSAPSSTSWTGCAAVTSTIWIAVNDSNSAGHAYSSDNGVTWSAGTLVTTASGCAGNGNNLAVVVNGTLTLRYTSDGTSFTTVTLAANGGSITNYNKIDYVCGYWIAYSSTSGRYIYTSTNGTTWSAAIDVTGGSYYPMRAINWNGSMWIIVCDNNSAYFTSTNLTSWTQRAFTNTRRYAGVAYIGTTWVVVCDGETAASNYRYTSTDGLTWTETTMSSTNRRWMDLTTVR